MSVVMINFSPFFRCLPGDKTGKHNVIVDIEDGLKVTEMKNVNLGISCNIFVLVTIVADW